MSNSEEVKGNLRTIRRKLVTNLIINIVVPLILYIVLRQVVANDTAALAIAGVIPITRSVFLWLLRRRIDLIGGLATLSFAIALGISYLSGGSPLALELRGSILAGIVGLICLISLIFEKPLLVTLIKIFNPNSSETPQSLNNQLSHQRLTTLTGVIGIALLGKALVDTLLALTLPTVTFLAMSHVVNWIILGGSLAFVWLTRQPANNRLHDNH